MTQSELLASAIVPPRSAVERRVAHLAWQNEAGGYSFSRDCILAMNLDEMDRYIQIADARRKARNDAIKKANAPKRRR